MNAIIILIISALLPLAFHSFFKKMGAKLSLSSYYNIGATLFILVTLTGHIYYFLIYDFSIFPSDEVSKFILYLIISLFIIFFLYRLIVKQAYEDIWSYFTFFFPLAVAFLLITNWLFPLVHKYNYVNRLETVEVLFAEEGKANTENGIHIELITSTYNISHLRGRYKSGRPYDNYFYIKNHRDTVYEGTVLLLPYTKTGKSIDAIEIENLHIPPGETELLKKDYNLSEDEWHEPSFSTRKQVESFDVLILEGF